MSINSKFVIPKQPKKKEDDPLAKPGIIFIYGPTGSGKTTLVANLLMALDKQHDFDEALYVSGNATDQFLDTLEMAVTSDPNKMNDFITKIMMKRDEPKHNLIVLDDVQANPTFNILSPKSDFMRLIISHRHAGRVDDEGGTWVILTAQTVRNSYNPTVRRNTSLWFVFMPRSEDEQKIIEEISGNKAQMKKAMAVQKQGDKHDFLYVNKRDVTNVRYFVGFDKELEFR